MQELGREPTLEEIAAELNLPIEKIIEANRTAADTLSLDMPVGDEEDTTIGSFVEDDNTPGPVDATSNAMLSEALTEILGTLTEREADVLDLICLTGSVLPYFYPVHQYPGFCCLTGCGRPPVR